MENGKTISEISKLLNLEISTIRYYEKERLIVPNRNSRGEREYDEEKILHLKYIMFLKKMQLSIAEIREIIKYFYHGYTQEVVTKIKETIAEKQKTLDEQQENLENLRETLYTISEILEQEDSAQIEESLDQIVMQEVENY